MTIIARAANSRSFALYWVALIVALFAIYLLTKSENHTTTEDALSYVISINAGFGPKLFQANHLLFNFVCWAALQACRPFGYTGDAAPVIHAINALAGALCVAVLFTVARRVFSDTALAATTAGALAVSNAFWCYSVETDTYILPLLLVLLAFRFFLDGLDKSVLPVAACLAVATLLHQQHVFTFWAFALAYFLLDGGPPAARLSKPALLLISGGGVTLIVYTVAGMSVIGLGGVWEVIAWSRGLAASGLWDPPSLASPLKAAIGFARAVFGFDVLFAFDWLYALIDQAFPDKLLVEERFASTRMPTVAVAVATASLIAAGAAAAWLVVGAANEAGKGRRALPAGHRASAATRRASLVLCLCCIGVLGPAATLWEPLNVEFWIAVLPFAFLLGGHLLVAFPRPHLRRAAPLFVACLGIANLVGTILPQTDRANDYWYTSNQALFAALRPGDLLITEGGYIANKYAEYFGGPAVTVVPTGKMPAAEIARRVEAHPSRVLISSWAFSPPPAVLRMKPFKDWDATALEKLHAALQPRLKPLLRSEAQTVWVLD